MENEDDIGWIGWSIDFGIRDSRSGTARQVWEYRTQLGERIDLDRIALLCKTGLDGGDDGLEHWLRHNAVARGLFQQVGDGGDGVLGRHGKGL